MIGTVYGGNDAARGALTTATNLQTVSTDISSAFSTMWQIVEFPADVVASVQHVNSGNITAASSPITIAPVDITKSLLFASMEITGNWGFDDLYNASFTDSTTVTFNRYAGVSTTNIDLYVIEFVYYNVVHGEVVSSLTTESHVLASTPANGDVFLNNAHNCGYLQSANTTNDLTTVASWEAELVGDTISFERNGATVESTLNYSVIDWAEERVLKRTPLPKTYSPDFQNPRVKPVGPVEIDWSNPLTEGLWAVYLMEGPDPLNLVNGKRASRIGTPDFSINGQEGKVFSEHNSAANSGLTLNNGAINSNEITVLGRTSYGDVTIDHALFNINAQALVFWADTNLGALRLAAYTGTSPNYASTFATVANYDKFYSIGLQAVRSGSETSTETWVDGIKTATAANTGITDWTASTNVTLGIVDTFIKDTRGEISYAFIWSRRLNDADFKEVTDNPYQLLKPVQTVTYTPTFVTLEATVAGTSSTTGDLIVPFTAAVSVTGTSTASASLATVSNFAATIAGTSLAEAALFENPRGSVFLPKSYHSSFQDPRTKPTEQVELDLENPLVSSLHLYHLLDGSNEDLVKKSKLTRINASKYKVVDRGEVLAFDDLTPGSEQRATIPSDDLVDITGVGVPRSWGYILQIDGATSNKVLTDKANFTASNLWSETQDSGVGYEIRAGVDDNGFRTYSGFLSKGVRYHVLITYDGTSETALYIDGTLVSSTTGATDVAANGNDLTIFGMSGAGYASVGSLDSIFFFNKALSAGEARSLADSPYQLVKPKQELNYSVSAPGADLLVGTISGSATASASIATISYFDADVTGTSTATSSLSTAVSVARYLFNEASSGTVPTTVADDTGNGNTLTIDYASSAANWTSNSEGNGLDFTATENQAGMAIAELNDIANNGNLGSSLDDASEVWMTLVLQDIVGHSNAMRVFCIGTDAGNTDFSLTKDAGDDWEFRWNRESGGGSGEVRFEFVQNGSGVDVITIAVDTSQVAGTDGYRIWANNVIQTHDFTAYTQNDNIDLINNSNRSISIGNRPSQNRNIKGTVYYAEIGIGVPTLQQVEDMYNELSSTSNDDNWAAITAAEFAANIIGTSTVTPGLEHTPATATFAANITSTSTVTVALTTAIEMAAAISGSSEVSPGLATTPSLTEPRKLELPKAYHPDFSNIKQMPTGPVDIDRNNPLGKEIRFLFLAGHQEDISSKLLPEQGSLKTLSRGYENQGQGLSQNFEINDTAFHYPVNDAHRQLGKSVTMFALIKLIGTSSTYARPIACIGTVAGAIEVENALWTLILSRINATQIQVAHSVEYDAGVHTGEVNNVTLEDGDLADRWIQITRVLTIVGSDTISEFFIDGKSISKRTISQVATGGTNSRVNIGDSLGNIDKGQELAFTGMAARAWSDAEVKEFYNNSYQILKPAQPARTTLRYVVPQELRFELPKAYHPDFKNPKVKPSGPVEIDWTNPVTQGLHAYFLLEGSNRDLVQGANLNLIPQPGSGGDVYPEYNIVEGDRRIEFNGFNSATIPSNALVDITGIGVPRSFGFTCVIVGDTVQNMVLDKSNFNGRHMWLETQNLGAGYRLDGGMATSNRLYSLEMDRGRTYSVVVTYDGVTGRLYVDGELIDTKAQTAHVADTQDYRIFGRTSDNTYNSEGNMERLFFYNRALSDEEVLSLYQTPNQLLKPATSQVYSVKPVNSAFIISVDKDNAVYDGQIEVEVLGTDFGTTTGTVTIDGQEQTISHWSNHSITITVVASAIIGTFNLIVTTA